MSAQPALQGPSASPEEARTVLIVDDEPSMRTALSETVRRMGYQVRGAIDGADAIEQVERIKPWLVVTDLKMPRVNGLELVKALKQKAPNTFIILMTAYGTVETAVEAMKCGANDYILKPFSTDLLERVILNLQASTDPEEQDAPATLEARAILTQDPGMIRLLTTLEGVAASQATVLISGESGTGKELLARYIHARSPRAHRPFVALNCAALPDSLLESELFGHERGAFTGAIHKKLGKFEMAHTGTLFLDEISEMNLGLQSKLLRVLQEREVDRIGGREPVPVNIRVIATTNRSLYHEVTQGRFREDLFYRLNVFPVTVPPLRERPGDIPLLARHFLRSSAQRNGMSVPTLSDRAIADLQQRAWKGNVRELENVMERAILVTTGNAVDTDHLMPGDGAVPVQPLETVETLVAPSAHGSLWEMERDLIFKTLARVNDNRTHAAKELGISIRTLRNKLREYRDLGHQVEADKP
jgi:two-component system response regulator FlrC